MPLGSLNWLCKDCGSFHASRTKLLKHFRLVHGHYGHTQAYPCAYTHCPCTFKTWNALRSHLCRSHGSQKQPQLQNTRETTMIKCHVCAATDIPSVNDYFLHINNHLRSHETVSCMFKDCSFKTNVYGTFKSHKSRKHCQCSLADFKEGIVKTQEESGVSEDSLLNEEMDASVKDDDFNYTDKDEVPENLTELVELKSASLLLKLENYYHVPGTVVDELLEDLHYLLSDASFPLSCKIIVDILQKHRIDDNQFLVKELVTALSTTNPLLAAIKRGGLLSSAFKRKQYYREHFKVVDPVEYVLEAKGKRTYQYVPILESLQILLGQNDLLDKVVEGHSSQSRRDDHQYRSMQDGMYFKTNDFFSEELRISLCFYVDDFEICNPLGTSRKKHKLCAIYWILGNVPTVFQSALSSINLAVLCKTEDVKAYGFDKILQPLLRDLQTLEQQGVYVHKLGTFLKGTVQCVVADNLAAHSMAGFIENFSGDYCCRFCTASRKDFQTSEVRAGNFTLRTAEEHQGHVKHALESNVNVVGVKKACVFSDSLNYFNVTTGYPPDLAHDLFEGIVPVELAECFAVLISKKILSLDRLNELIHSFPYKWSDKTNRPQLVPQTFASRTSVGGNAHENWCLLRLLPLIIGHLVPEDEPVWLMILDLKDIVELVLSLVHTDETLAFLECKISEHRQKHQELFPSKQLLPKHHFLEHYPEMIRRFGPLVFLWTLRFESKHSYFKQVVRHTNCFKNITLTLASKHQLMAGYNTHIPSREKTNFQVTHVSNVAVEVLKDNVVHCLNARYPGITTLSVARNVSYAGITYRNGMIIAHGSLCGFPEFAEITQICIIEDSLAFIAKKLSSWYHEHFRAFELVPSHEICLIPHSELKDPHPLADYMVGGVRMITLKRHILIDEVQNPPTEVQ